MGTIQKTEERDDKDIDRTIPFLKSYHVFNTDEIDNLPAQYRAAPPVPVTLDPSERKPDCDSFVAGTCALVFHGGGKAYFSPSRDEVHMPEFGAFSDAGLYYSTMFHELTHWTGHKPRLDRLSHKVFGDPDYAFEEPVAELGASYLCADLAVDAEPREDHASYIASWLKCLKADNRNVFRAASYAEKACTYLHGLQPKAADAPADMELAA